MNEMKKAIAIQFFWVFVIIAGAIILAFFVSLTMKYKSLNEQKIAAELAQNFNTVIAASLQAEGTVQNITIPNTGVKFDCTTGCNCRVYTGKSAKDYEDKIILAPAELEETDMTFWTEPFTTPFKGANILYITNPMTRYYIIGTETGTKIIETLLKNDLPPEINAIYGMPANPEPGYTSYRIITVDGEIPTTITIPDWLKKEKLDAMEYTTSGEAKYYTWNRKTDDWQPPSPIAIPADGRPLLYAAIFAKNSVMYECMLAKTLERTKRIARIYQERSAMLANTVPECQIAYLSAETRFKEIADYNGGLLATLGGMQVTKLELDDLNNFLKRESCPLLY